MVRMPPPMDIVQRPHSTPSNRNRETKMEDRGEYNSSITKKADSFNLTTIA